MLFLYEIYIRIKILFVCSLYQLFQLNKKFKYLSFIISIVTCRPVSRKRVGKHVSAEMRFLNTNHRWVLNRRFLGYQNENCRLLENSSLRWNQQACPWIRASNRHFPRIPLCYINGRSDKNEVIRNSFNRSQVVNQTSVLK
jgi:hypothetical protein